MRSFAPALVVALAYLLTLLAQEAFGLPVWVSWILLFSAAFAALVVLSAKISSLRVRTRRELEGVEQIVDEPIELQAPSGAMVVTDLSTLRAWKSRSSINESPEELVDMRLSGPNSWEVARKLGLSTPYIYDVPSVAASDFLKIFTKESMKHSSRVKASTEPHRIQHLARVRRALERGPGLFNIRERELLSVPLESARLVRSWFVDGKLEALDLCVDGKDNEEIDLFKIVGTLKFHSNTLVVADSDALEDWDSFMSRDGLFDLVLIGEASSAAAAMGGRQVQPSTWVFNNVEFTQAQRIGRSFFEEDPQARWALNPHSDEFFMASQLALDPVAERTLPGGSVHAMRLDAKEALVAVGYSAGGDMLKVRLAFQADLSNVYLLPPPGRFETLVSKISGRLSRR